MTTTNQKAICPVCNREFKSERAVKTHMGRSACKELFQEQQMQDEFDESHHEVVTGEAPEIATPKNTCLCGCLGSTKGKRLFLQGHDMKLKSRIKNSPETLVSEQIAYAKLSWPTFWIKYCGGVK